MKKGIINAAYVVAALLALASLCVLVTDVTDTCKVWLTLLIKGAALAVLFVCSWLLPPVREKVEELGYELPLRLRR
jgi:hypothetical protein